MNVFATIIVVLGIVVITAFIGYEIFQLVRDIQKAIKVKKAKKQTTDSNDVANK